MPVILDVAKEAVEPGKRRDLTNGVPLALTLEQRSSIVLTKYISTDPLHADWQPEGEWLEQVTTDVGGGRRKERIQVLREGGSSSGANVDDGLIIDLVGTLTGIVGILPGRQPMSESDVEAYIDATQEPVPLYQQWDFRVRRVLKTDGPAARFGLTRSEDQRRQQAQTEMFDAIRKAFELGFGVLAAKGDLGSSAQNVLAEGLKKAK